MPLVCFFFFFNDTATTEIYPLSLHDPLPISACPHDHAPEPFGPTGWNVPVQLQQAPPPQTDPAELKLADRKSTRLNSSHLVISYAVFCLKKKKTDNSRLSLSQTVISAFVNRV